MNYSVQPVYLPTEGSKQEVFANCPMNGEVKLCETSRSCFSNNKEQSYEGNHLTRDRFRICLIYNGAMTCDLFVNCCLTRGRKNSSTRVPKRRSPVLSRKSMT